MLIDSHAHVFRIDLPRSPDARYWPTKDATPETYIELLRRDGLSAAMLSAPSFLGSDNSYLTSVLRAYPDRFRATAVVDPAIEHSELQKLADTGFVGVRLNLSGRDRLPDLSGSAYRRLFENMRSLGMHVELWLEVTKMPQVLPILRRAQVDVVLDHFAGADAVHDADDGCLRSVLDAVTAGRTWVKLSAPYRLELPDPGRYARLLLRAGGPERLMWGSDWPWTLTPPGLEYGRTLRWLDEWVPDEHDRAVILGETPAQLFGFARPSHRDPSRDETTSSCGHLPCRSAAVNRVGLDRTADAAD